MSQGENDGSRAPSHMDDAETGAVAMSHDCLDGQRSQELSILHKVGKIFGKHDVHMMFTCHDFSSIESLSDAINGSQKSST